MGAAALLAVAAAARAAIVAGRLHKERLHGRVDVPPPPEAPVSPASSAAPTSAPPAAPTAPPGYHIYRPTSAVPEQGAGSDDDEARREGYR